ncbi:MAG TPA: polysaccharide deacetylase family protein [Rectinemataceae bacterium]
MRYSRLTVFLALILSLCSGLILASCVSAPGAAEAKNQGIPEVRYWENPTRKAGLAAMTVSGESLAAHEVPKRESPRVVILMYHNIVFGRTGNEYNRDIYNFEHDLAFIRARYQIIDLGELLDYAAGKKKLEHDAAIITFDDGDLSMYAIAYPLLREYGIKATFFLISGFVGDVGYMNWNQIAEMARYEDENGQKLFTMASHGKSHARMGELGLEDVRIELEESKLEIEKRIGMPVEFLALPFGSGAGNEAIQALARSLGYRGIRTSDNLAPPLERIQPYRLPGIYIDNRGTDTMMQAVWSLSGH